MPAKCRIHDLSFIIDSFSNINVQVKNKVLGECGLIAIVIFGLFAILYNFTAYSYIPIYLVLYFIGLTLTKKLSKKNTVEI